MNDIKFCEYNPKEENKYAWALCNCPISLNYGWKIKRTEKNRNVTFYCPKCKTKIGMWVTKER